MSAPLSRQTSPEYSIRGHQLGYRATANSYDAWSVEQYERYIDDSQVLEDDWPEVGQDASGGGAPGYDIFNLMMDNMCLRDENPEGWYDDTSTPQWINDKYYGSGDTERDATYSQPAPDIER